MKNINSVPEGNWIITYNPQKVAYRDMLENWLKIWTWYKDCRRSRLTCLEFDPELSAPCFSSRYNTDCLRLNSADLPAQTARCPVTWQSTHSFDPEIIQNISLVFPSLQGDSRWNSMGIPSSVVFLGSPLAMQGYHLSFSRIAFPMFQQAMAGDKPDLLGISLFEDLFTEISAYLQDFAEIHPKTTIAAGGPMATLNPVESLYFLPQINLLVRGEGDNVFPSLLKSLKAGDAVKMAENHQGFVYQKPGLIIAGNLQSVNRPADFSHSGYSLDFLESRDFTHGIELNLSRGCRRSCVFCSKVQGKKYRQLEITSLARLLEQADKKIMNASSPQKTMRTVNINDDDILQNPDYAADVFALLIRKGFRLWGVQSSINSMFVNRKIDNKLLELIANRELYVNSTPLIWFGTDAFTQVRGKRLGKKIPDPGEFDGLLAELENRGIASYHYWICSDQLLSWQEFVDELMIVITLWENYSYFNILAHSPFLVPYASTPLFALIKQSGIKKQLILKDTLVSKNSVIRFPLAQKVITPHTHLNRMLENHGDLSGPGLLDLLRQRSALPVLKLVYGFLKKERLFMQGTAAQNETDSLIQLESKLESEISGRL